jgi:chromosome segregation ATPase
MSSISSLQLLKAEISSLAETKANLESTISALEGRIASLESDYSHSQTALQASVEDSARLSTTVTQLEQTTRTLTESLAATESALQAIEAAAEKQKLEFDAAWAEKETCLSKALQELAQLDAERMSVGRRVTELELQLETQRSVASEAFKELETTKQVGQLFACSQAL